ncbi:MAG: hypothetical protein ACTSYB_15060 [Candidatus Helarchaeota archaeon]
MILLADTCFLSHIRLLAEDNIYDFRKLWTKFRWGITSDIQKELKHFNLFAFFANKLYIYIIPISNDEISDLCIQFPTLTHFDRADQSLIAVALREDAIILTDDGDLLMECITIGISAMSLPVFCLNLVKNNLMSKTECYHLLKFWEVHHHYTQKELKRWKNQLRLL